MALTLRVPLPAAPPTRNNIQKGRQSFRENASLPPTSPDDFLRFLGASWAFCAEFLFYTYGGKGSVMIMTMSDEWAEGLICNFNGFKNTILGLSDVRRMEAKLALPVQHSGALPPPLGRLSF